jgi:hypothetical protein
MADDVKSMLLKQGGQARISDIHFVKLTFGVYVFAVAREEVVDHDHLVAGCDVCVHDVGTDEPGSASNENVRHEAPRKRLRFWNWECAAEND